MESRIQFKIDGYFETKTELNRCIQELTQAGVGKDSIQTQENVIIRPVSPAQKKQLKNYRKEMGVAGGGVGASIGVLIGYLFGSGYLNFGFLQFGSASSPYASIVLGLIVGATFGTVLGALVGHQIPAGENHFHRLSVNAQKFESIELVKFIFAEFGGIQIEVFSWGRSEPPQLQPADPSPQTVRS